MNRNGPLEDLPQSSPLNAYRVPQGNADLFADAPHEVVDSWQRVASGISTLCDGSLAELHDRVQREITDLGMTFRLSGEKEERPWPLNPMPLLISGAEWAELSRGLIQRADLLERVIADIYGDQTLINDGHLPAAIVTGSPQFERKMRHILPPSGHYLQVCAIDLARGPGGKWRVLADRLSQMAGIGYALENRLATARTTGSLLSEISVQRLAAFFANLRRGIAANCSRDDPRIALLSPGKFSQSYAEQAHLARYLGFPLVEGRDLTVSHKRLYVRTIAGLKRIDAVWRWINTEMLDPLAFDTHSQIGVPDIFEATSAGELAMANWPGSGVLQARAFSAFMPRLAKVMLGEGLLLPNMATWWCGQEAEREVVARRLEELVVSSAFGGPVVGLAGGKTRAGASLNAAEREVLFAAMARRPLDYVGQEIVHLSTTPALIGDNFEPRPFTLRAFLARGADGGWMVMPGGFARLSASGDLRTSLVGAGDFSSDVCIIGNANEEQVVRVGPDQVPAIRRARGILPSHAADNLYWFSRYAERAENTLRIIRALLASTIEDDGGGNRRQSSQQRLVDLLQRNGAVSKRDAALPTLQLCLRAFQDAEPSGSIATLAAILRDIGGMLRDRFSTDLLRIINLPVPTIRGHSPQSVLIVTNIMLDRFSTISGLSAENMARSQAWRFFELGRRIERAAAICRTFRQLGGRGSDSADLGVLLDLFDSQISYRSRYLVGPMREPVADLLLLDPDNPRGLAFQIEQIGRELDDLPQNAETGLPDAPWRQFNAVKAHLFSLEVSNIDDQMLQNIETRLLALSDIISQRYFLQYERVASSTQDSLLA